MGDLQKGQRECLNFTHQVRQLPIVVIDTSLTRQAGAGESFLDKFQL